MTFHFSTEITAFTRPLGEMCPGPFVDRVPVMGDTVDIDLDIAGVQVSSGVIVAEMVCSEALSALVKRAVFHDVHNWMYRDNPENIQQDQRLLAASFDSVTAGELYDLYGDLLACWVEFQVEISAQAAARLAHDLDSGTLATRSDGEADAPTGDRLTVRLAQRDGRPTLAGCARCLVSSMDVQSTAAMEAFKARHAANREVEHVAWSDQAAPPSLWRHLNADIDDLCQREPADYHPGSGGVVRDIVHPSLYCYVSGVSVLKPWAHSNTTPAGSSDPNARPGRDFWGRPLESSRYQWLPAEVEVTSEGRVTFGSDINNLSRARYPRVYDHLAALFTRALPLLEGVCSRLRNDFYTGRWHDEPRGPIAMPLRNRRLQVVTKIVEYRVNAETQFDGTWHVEGMAHEHILATVLCIVKRDAHFLGAEIEFRRYLFQQEGDDLVTCTPQNAMRPTDTMGGGDVRPLGCMETPEERIMVFPNSHIHRIGLMRSASGQDAVRRIVVFWLVNPEQRILSTRDVAVQQGVMPHDQALDHRLQLMEERMRHKETYAQREVFLCEH